MSPILSAEIEFRYGGGNGGASKFGGAIDNTGAAIIGGAATNTFDDITSGEAASGETTYSCVFVKNATGSGETWKNPKVWIDGTPAIPSSTAAIALDKNGRNHDAVTIATETTAPDIGGTAWASPTTKATGLPLGDLAPGDYYAIWERRVISSGSGTAPDGISIRCEGDTFVA